MNEPQARATDDAERHHLPRVGELGVSGEHQERDARSPDTERNEAMPTLLEQMGGVHGLIYSSVPVVVFVVTNALTSLTPAIWAAVGSAVLIGVWRLVRKEPLQPAVSGVLGVGIAAWIAHRTGSAKGFFLLGIWISLVYGGVLLLSVLLRWPLVGVAWSVLNGSGFAWRNDLRARHAYDLATLAWVLVFAARFVVQRWLYDTDQTGWLAVARLAMGWPLAALALLVTIWSIRRVSRLTAAERQQVSGS